MGYIVMEPFVALRFNCRLKSITIETLTLDTGHKSHFVNLLICENRESVKHIINLCITNLCHALYQLRYSVIVAQLV